MKIRQGCAAVTLAAMSATLISGCSAPGREDAVRAYVDAALKKFDWQSLNDMRSATSP